MPTETTFTVNPTGGDLKFKFVCGGDVEGSYKFRCFSATPPPLDFKGAVNDGKTFTVPIAGKPTQVQVNAIVHPNDPSFPGTYHVEMNQENGKTQTTDPTAWTEATVITLVPA